MTRIALLFVSALAISACGGNLCDRSAKDAESCGQTISDADVDSCKEALSSCSKDEEKQLEDMYNCMADAGFTECADTGTTTTTTTTTGGTDDFAKLLECAALASDVGPECAGALGGGGGTTTTTGTTTTGS